MVIERETLPFWLWLVHGSDSRMGALPWLLVVAGCLVLVALVGGYLLAALRYGLIPAGDLTYRVVSRGVKELFCLSRRRVAALAWLAVKESLRRRVMVALVVFLVILLFAAWFLGTNKPEPAKLYVNFVLTATTYLVLLLALFLSAFSLPNDIKQKTIHTVVTKPVRAGEVVLGRIIGFSIVGALMLGIMGVCSYLFVVRALYHTHQVDTDSLTDIEGAEGAIGKQGRTSRDAHHRHVVTLDQKGQGWAEMNHGHRHRMTSLERAGQVRYDTSSPEGMFRARVPVYGKLRFKDRKGADVEKGISVGNEWTYRSYIEGGTLAAAVWTFDGIDPLQYPEGLPLEVTISVFRTHKGTIEEGILGSIVVKNPSDPKKASDAIIFSAKEYTIDRHLVKRQLTDAQGNPLDLFQDLVHDGKVEIWVQCLDQQQYFGMAQPDCYLQAREGSFLANFVKGFTSIGVQMLMVISFAVMGSTFLSGPVAMMFTLAVIVLGFFKQFIVGVATGVVVGGGPIESLVRLVTQKNVTADLEEGWGTTVMQGVDAGFLLLMRTFAEVLPDFRNLSTVRYVADGFDISLNMLAQQVLTGLVYLAALFVMGYFFFRTREVAR